MRVPDLLNADNTDKEKTSTVAHLRTAEAGWLMLSIFKSGEFLIQNTSIPKGRQSLSTIDEIQFPALQEWIVYIIRSVDGQNREKSKSPLTPVGSILKVSYWNTSTGRLMLVVYEGGEYLIRNTMIPVGRQSLDTIKDIQFPALKGWVESVLTTIEGQ